MAICSSLYPILQTLEVALRNSLHNVISNHIKNKYWFIQNNLLRSLEINIVQNTLHDIKKVNKPVNSDLVVSQLSFGFWTNILDKRYEQIFWPHLLKLAFPYIPRSQRTRDHISRRFNKVRNLRNRIFHHQRIWHWLDLPKQHSDMIEAIG